MKFMHISDVHLGVRPDALKPWSKQRAQDIWDTFAEVIEKAAKVCPDFLFITGDLFHAQPLKKELKEVNGLFRRIPDTKIVICAGNHDYIRTKSCYLTFEWAENVYFFNREEIHFFDFPQKNTTIYGMSYWHREIRESIFDKVVPKDSSRTNILLVHGGDETHIPFSPVRILENGFDFVAAGHIHKGSQLIKGKAVMAGSLEPTDCNDTGPHGCWIGEINQESTSLHFYPVKKCEYCHEVYEVHRETTELEIYEWAKALREERPSYQYFRLFLKGYKDPDMEYDMSRVCALERIVDVTEQLTLAYDYGKLEREHKNTLLSNYIRAMNGRPQDTITKKALEYGVNALLGHKI